MLQRRGSRDPQVAEYILPCFLTMDSSTPLHTQLKNLTSAPGFLQVPGSSVLPGALAFHFLPLSPVSLGKPMQMWMPETSWYSKLKIHKRHLFGCDTVSKESLRQGMTSTQHTTWKLSFRRTWPKNSSSYSYCWLFPKADHSWPFWWESFLWLSLSFLLLPTPNSWGTSLVISLFVLLPFHI